MKKKNPEREEKLRQFRRDYHRIALETFASPSAGASLYESMRPKAARSAPARA